jgi:hypothetical protein
MCRRAAAVWAVAALAAHPLLLCAAAPLTSFAPTFTGFVENDFPADNLGVFVAVDPNPPILFLGTAATGWDVVDIRFAYDAGSDTAYFGVRAACVFGDADCDGDPGATSPDLLGDGGACEVGSTTRCH